MLVDFVHSFFSAENGIYLARPEVTISISCLRIRNVTKQGQRTLVKKNPLHREKEEILFSPMTKAPTPTEKPKKQRENRKATPKTSITQRLQTDFGRSVGITIATQLVCFKPVKYGTPTFPLTATAVLSKGHTATPTRQWTVINMAIVDRYMSPNAKAR